MKKGLLRRTNPRLFKANLYPGGNLSVSALGDLPRSSWVSRFLSNGSYCLAYIFDTWTAGGSQQARPPSSPLSRAQEGASCLVWPSRLVTHGFCASGSPGGRRPGSTEQVSPRAGAASFAWWFCKEYARMAWWFFLALKYMIGFIEMWTWMSS